MLLVGIGLYAYYAQYPLGEGDAALIAKNRNNIFPLFIIRAVPTGLAGLLIAGIFAAAVGSLNGVLTSLSQTTISAVWSSSTISESLVGLSQAPSGRWQLTIISAPSLYQLCCPKYL